MPPLGRTDGLHDLHELLVGAEWVQGRLTRLGEKTGDAGPAEVAIVAKLYGSTSRSA